MHATHGQPPPAEALARIDEHRRKPDRSERARAMLDRLESDGLWSKLPPALKGRKATLLVDIAMLAFDASDGLSMPFPRHFPQQPIERRKLRAALVENLRPDKGPAMAAERGQSFLDALKEGEPSARAAMGSGTYDALCSMIGAVIGPLRTRADQNREEWQAIGFPPPPSRAWNANTRRDYFVTVAGWLLRAAVEQPHHAVVAALANVAYPPRGDEGRIGADAVRKRRGHAERARGRQVAPDKLIK